ncbi:hypothetical protein JOM56_009299 [Amanita muscaria]
MIIISFVCILVLHASQSLLPFRPLFIACKQDVNPRQHHLLHRDFTKTDDTGYYPFAYDHCNLTNTKETTFGQHIRYCVRHFTTRCSSGARTDVG